MNWIVCYDIASSKRLQKIAKIMEDYGVRVQKSVFEMEINFRELSELKQRAETIINWEQDSVKYYPLCGNCMKLLWKFGANTLPEDIKSFLIF